MALPNNEPNYLPETLFINSSFPLKTYQEIETYEEALKHNHQTFGNGDQNNPRIVFMKPIEPQYTEELEGYIDAIRQLCIQSACRWAFVMDERQIPKQFHTWQERNANRKATSTRPFLEIRLCTNSEHCQWNCVLEIIQDRKGNPTGFNLDAPSVIDQWIPNAAPSFTRPATLHIPNNGFNQNQNAANNQNGNIIGGFLNRGGFRRPVNTQAQQGQGQAQAQGMANPPLPLNPQPQNNYFMGNLRQASGLYNFGVLFGQRT